MNQITISKKSLAYRFLCFCNGSYEYIPPQTICEYGRALLIEFLTLLFFVSIGSFILIALGTMILSKTDCQVIPFIRGGCGFTHSILLKMVIAFFTGIVSLVVTMFGMFLLGGVCFGITTVYNLIIYKSIHGFLSRGDTIPKKELNSVVRAYLAWKEKTCYKIKFD